MDYKNIALQENMPVQQICRTVKRYMPTTSDPDGNCCSNFQFSRHNISGALLRKCCVVKIENLSDNFRGSEVWKQRSVRFQIQNLSTQHFRGFAPEMLCRQILNLKTEIQKNKLICRCDRYFRHINRFVVCFTYSILAY